MPVPGPRNQFGPDPGYSNPGGEMPTRFNQWNFPKPTRTYGESPGTMVINLRGNVLAPGQIRKMYRQSINMIGAQAPFSWTDNSPAPGRPAGQGRGFHITNSLRYMTRSLYMGAGIDNTRFDEMHTIIEQRHHYKPVTVAGGSVRYRPTVRNRMTSFGSRVPTLNPPVVGAETSSAS